MARTLIIAGTLAARGVHERLTCSEAAETAVVEVDSLIDRPRYPLVAAWGRLSEIITLHDAQAIHESAESLMEGFLSHEQPAENLPTCREFRAACMGAQTWRLIIPHLLNLRLAQHCLEQFQPAQIIVAAGSGVHFEAWKEAADRAGKPIVFLHPERTYMDLRRRLWKWWRRWKKSAPPRLCHLPPAEGGGGILCTSERLSRLLASQATDMKVQGLAVHDLRVADAAQQNAMAQRYQQWWNSWQAEAGNLMPAPLKNVGRFFIEKIYPAYACLYLQARRRLEALRPRLVLCDTQAGTPERMWSLAAQELGIPVVAYNYDHMPQPRFSFMPDILLADSGRSAMTAAQNGVPEERIVTIQSHRKPKMADPIRTGGAACSRRPQIIYTDSYYAGTRADLDPACSFPFYQLVVETARRLSTMDFAIKFHPLRERKQPHLSFVAMDETELRLRQQFIQKLRPPPNLRCIAPEENLHTHLQQADVLLNYNSTSGLEAFEMGVPVVFLQHLAPNVRAYPNIHEFQACLSAEGPHSLARAIEELVRVPAARELQIDRQRRYIREFYWPPGPSLKEGIEICCQRLLPRI